MKKPLWVALAVALAAVAVFVFVRDTRHGEDAAAVNNQPVGSLDVTIENRSFTLVDGVAEKPAAPDSAAKDTLRMVGPEVRGDVTGDGAPEVALLLSNDSGGSGTFYYAVLAIANGNSWHATNALPLGDRIKPKGIEFTDGHFVYRFLERAPGQPMAETPTVERSVLIRFDPASERISAGQ